MDTESPVRHVVGVALSLAVAVSLAGCAVATSSRSTTSSGGPSTSLVPAVSAASAASSGPTSGTSSSRTATASASPTTPRTCSTSQLSLSLTAGAGSGAGHTFPYLLLTNSGTTPCTVTGYPGVSFVGDGNGTQLGAAATREAGGVPVTTLRLAPGASAHSQLSIASAGSYDAATCRPKPADGLRVYPPDQTRSLFVATSGMSACQNGAITLLVVRPLQAGAA